MIKKYKYLLRMQLYSIFGINRLYHSHDKKETQRTAIVAALAFVAITILVISSTKFSVGMAEAGFVEVLPTIMVVLSAFVTLILTFIKSTGVLIGLKDYDMIMSMPVNTQAIVMSRLTMLYLINIFISLLVMLPSCVVFVWYVNPASYVYFYLMVTLLFTPIIPMLLSLSLGVLIVAISTRTKHKNIFSLILSTGAVLLILYLTTKAQTMDSTQITNLGKAMATTIEKMYLPASLVSNAILMNNLFDLGLFMVLSIFIGVIFVAVVSKFYKAMNTAVFSHHARKNFTIKELKKSSPFLALYKKELSRLSSCTIYALNSCIGMVLLFVISLIAVFFNLDAFIIQMKSMGILGIIQNVLPLILAIFVSMSSTSAPSLSLEGKNRWIMCSIPTKAKTVFDAKIAVNLTVVLPVVVMSACLLRIVFPLSIGQTLLLFMVPILYAFFISVIGIFLNIKFPKYDWVSEYYAVKGGAISVLATVGVGMASSLLPLYLCFFFSDYAILIMVIDMIIILSITILVYQKVCKTELFAV